MVIYVFSGREYHKNDPAVTVDYNTADPVVRWDSYENFNQRYQDSLEGKRCLHSHHGGAIEAFNSSTHGGSHY